MRNRYFFFWVLFLKEGVFGVEKYNVMEGDSVTLNPGDTKIPEEDTAQWWFGDKLIARMNKGNNINSISEGNDAGFKDRLKLDQTGSLTITDTRTTDSGEYKLLIKSTTETYKIFKVTVDEIKIMSMKDGDPVTLQFDTEIQSDDLILWMFGPKSTCIAEINKKVNTSLLHKDVLGGIFRGRLKLDHRTGSLTITDTRTEHTGLYKVELTSSRGSTYTRFIVTLTKQDTTDRKTLIGIIVFLLLLLVGAIAGFVIYRKKCRQPGANRNYQI
ncbi:uncharacterized protein LOC132159574 isoform X1 [Carassius carassius]|uniref:uncharacterized protein LOC132159574 isoform X1 n=1 Tax=Carassius carassius TaxID=217509 RepID=UPI0028689ABB|nr:uncharacterized protein LOC132159574 isoform X1 [Carassius carassius]